MGAWWAESRLPFNIFNDHLEIFFYSKFYFVFSLKHFLLFLEKQNLVFPFQFGSTMRYKHKGFDSNFFIASYLYVLLLFSKCCNYCNSEKQLLLPFSGKSRDQTWGQNYKRHKIIQCHLLYPIAKFFGGSLSHTLRKRSNIWQIQGRRRQDLPCLWRLQVGCGWCCCGAATSGTCIQLPWWRCLLEAQFMLLPVQGSQQSQGGHTKHRLRAWDTPLKTPVGHRQQGFGSRAAAGMARVRRGGGWRVPAANGSGGFHPDTPEATAEPNQWGRWSCWGRANAAGSEGKSVRNRPGNSKGRRGRGSRETIHCHFKQQLNFLELILCFACVSDTS